MKRPTSVLVSALAALLALALAAPAAAGEPGGGPSTREIIDALKPRPPAVRSHHPRPRGIQVIAPEGGTPPAIDFHVTFAFDSAELTDAAAAVVDRLGEALTSDALRSSRFQVAGYTDTTGGEAYNQDLSERRAAAVARRLEQKFGIAPGRLSIRGFGRTQLLDPAHPLDEVNRRVRVTNLGPGG